MGQWSELVGELFEDIERNLVLYGDKVRIRAVCDSWNSHLEKMPNHKANQLPSLFQPLHNNNSASHGLFNLVEKKFYLLDLPGVAQGKLFIGFSHGWLSTIQYLNPSNYAVEMHLINPLTSAVIQLPPRIKFPDVVEYCAARVDDEYTLLFENFDYEPVNDRSYFTDQISLIYLMGKVILSSPPSHGDCVVVAIYGLRNKLAYCKHNDKKWTSMRAKFTAPHAGGFLDILFHKGKLYGLNAASGLVFFDDISPNPKMTEVVVEGPRGNPLYLVESCDGELLMVRRVVESLDGENSLRIIRTLCFKVYKLDLSNSSWIEVEDIGDDMLFVGYNSSVSMSSRDFPGYKGNCIYFTDSYTSYGGKELTQEDSDIGVFNLKDGSIEPLPGFKCDPRFIWPPPIWVTPPPRL